MRDVRGKEGINIKQYRQITTWSTSQTISLFIFIHQFVKLVEGQVIFWNLLHNGGVDHDVAVVKVFAQKSR